MANNNNEGADYNPDNSKESGSDKSFVEKFVSGIINSTPLSKWFGKDTMRRRDEDEESDASFTFLPPSKRAKLPSETERNSYSAHVFESPVTVHASNNVNNVSSKVLGKFPEPVPGPSGIKSRKLFEKQLTSSTNTLSMGSFENQLEIINGHDSDSGESTSGYISAPKLGRIQVSGEDTVCEKGTPKTRSLFTPSNTSGGGRSLFAERSPQMNTSLSSRRPTFNASTFGSPNFIDTTLSTKRIMESPFYSGRTMYGGASAYGRRLGKKSEELSSVARNSVQIKPVNEKLTSENATLSKTARRILSTLEQYSTPISDAKKIPVVPRKSGLLSNYVGATPYLVRDRKKPSNRELQVPTIPDLLHMKQKERLQSSTENVRQIASKSKSALNTEEYKLRTEDNKQKHSNKMKNSVSSVRQKVQPIEPVNEVKLPKVSLPITTLPKFDFVLMQPSNTNENKNVETNKTIIKPTVVVEKKETETKAVEKAKSEYTFSDPLIVTKEMKPIAAINCFKFSEPLSADSKTKGGGTFKMKNNGETVKSVSTDVSKKKKDVPISPSEKWECPTCLDKNDSDKRKCSACDEPKPQTSPEKQSKGFGDQFKLSSDKWECGSCLVRNNNSDTKCIACATNRPTGNKTVTSDFGDKFKPSASTWECTTCLIRNKNELDKCEACGTAKVGVASNFGNKFKPMNETWECNTCLIRNNNELLKCAACAGAKPGFGEAFKTKVGEWECSSCMVRNKSTTNVCVCCGGTKPGSSSEKLVEIAKKEEKKPINSFNFGIDKSGTTQFKFGIPADKKETVESAAVTSTPPTTAPTFTFGISAQEKVSTTATAVTSTDSVTATVSNNPLLKPTEKLPEKATSAPIGFKFGLTNSQTTQPINTNVETATTSTVSTSFVTTTMPGFQFKPSTINGEVKNDENKSNIFTTDLNKSKDTVFGGADTNKNKESPFTSKLNKSAESLFGTTSKATGSPFAGKDESPFGGVKTQSPFSTMSKPSGSPFGTSSTPVNPPFGTSNKSSDSPYVISSKPSDSPFVTSSKPADSPFVTSSKSSDSPFGTSSKPIEVSFGTNKNSPFTASTTKRADSPFNTKSDSPFGSMNKTVESPFGTTTTKPAGSPFGSTTTKPSDSPFGNTTTKPSDSPFGSATTKPSDSPFGSMVKPSEPFRGPSTPFGTLNKPTESPFAKSAEVNKKESLFGNPADANKPTLFGNVAETTKTSEVLFGADPKPKDIPFGSKPADATAIFTAPTSAPAFSFTPKPVDNTTFPSQPSGIFKFGSDAHQTSTKRGASDSDNVSNGFGSSSKIPAFGPPQGFGVTESKPFNFGTPEAPKSSGFSFGQTDKPSSAAPVFSFGNSAPAAPSAAFNFTAPSAGFNFGAAAPKVETFNAPNVFGTAGTGAKNGSFNFGTGPSNNNQKVVFSFGANQTNQQSQPSFPAPPSQQGFNFAPPAALNVPPTGAFNFTGGPPSFNFTDGTSGQAPPQRKIKKALRRTHR